MQDTYNNNIMLQEDGPGGHPQGVASLAIPNSSALQVNNGINKIEIIRQLLDVFKISYDTADIHFMESAYVSRQIELKEKKYTNILADKSKQFLKAATHDDIMSHGEYITNTIDHCVQLVNEVTKIAQNNIPSFKIADCTIVAPLSINGYAVISIDAKIFSQTGDDWLMILSNLICFLNTIIHFCHQVLELRHTIDNDLEQCLLNLAVQHNECEDFVDAMARMQLDMINLMYNNEKKKIDYYNTLLEQEASRNPIFQYEATEATEPKVFAQNMITTEGVSRAGLIKYWAFLKAGKILIPNYQLRMWLKDKYIDNIDRIRDFINLAFNILRGAKYHMTPSNAIAVIWKYLATSFCKEGTKSKEMFVAYCNSFLPAEHRLHPGTVANAISTYTPDDPDDVKRALNFAQYSSALQQ